MNGIATIRDMTSGPWRSRARRVVESRLRDSLRPNGETRPHYVVCGDDALAYWVVRTLRRDTPTSPVRITVIVPTRRRPGDPDITALRGVRIVRAERLNEETFRLAGLAGAAGLALLHQDDVGNIHAALCAQEVEPDLRLVMRMFNANLGLGVKRLFADCEVLSDASMAAPAFVAAALGEVAPTHFRHAGRTLLVARRTDVRPEHVVVGLADTREANNLRVLPSDESRADLVLAEATGRPAGTELAARRLARARWRHPFTGLLRGIRSFATRKIGMATLSVLAIVALFGFLLAQAEGVSIAEAVYLTLLTTFSGAEPEAGTDPRVQVMQVVLTLAGLALIPLITAAVVDGIVNAKLALTVGRLSVRRDGHVVVVGLGNVGSRVVGQLHDLGIEVVAVDKDPDARGSSLVRRLGVPFIVADGAQEETLRAASVATCQALVMVSTDDVTNLQAALNGRSLNPDLRVVLRLFDGDFAARIQRAFDITISRSVSYLAAPSFASALTNRNVIATIPVDRHVLLVAEVTVGERSPLDGLRLRDANRGTGVRVIGLARSGQRRMRWSPTLESRIRAGDRITVVARRAGLSWLLTQTTPLPPVPEAEPDPVP
ncbi:NAD-binding protein [Polymorphospora rubra]|uniref:Potassium transporter TrkA n=2 Tax=Polymorphospora rubra TaxID=338584 RepID=A0A810MXZ6_9ACTN|nr:potassium transporter TrkA [Polymorphospora rubra]